MKPIKQLRKELIRGNKETDNGWIEIVGDDVHPPYAEISNDYINRYGYVIEYRNDTGYRYYRPYTF